MTDVRTQNDFSTYQIWNLEPLGLTSGTGVVVIVTDQPRKNTNCCDDTRQGRPAAGISTSRKFVGFSLGSWDSLCAFCWMTDETTESRLLYQSTWSSFGLGFDRLSNSDIGLIVTLFFKSPLMYIIDQSMWCLQAMLRCAFLDVVITLSSQDMLVRQIDRDEIQTRSTAR